MAAPVLAALCCLTVPDVTSAQVPPTTSFQTSYRAYNAWDDWKWWQPDKCTQSRAVRGTEPTTPGRHPVLLYTHGTLSDWNGDAEGKAVAALAAHQGFVAAALEYDSWVASSAAALDANARCMYSSGQAGSALATVCARPKADCSKGVVVAGFSAGGAIAGRAANHGDVRAAWLLGVNGPAIEPALSKPTGTRALPDDRLRITVGRADVGSDPSSLNRLTGSACTSGSCLRADGSGYVIVEHAEVADGAADHCFWLAATPASPANSCTWNPTFDPGFRPPATRPWSLLTNLSWLRSRLG